MAKLKGEVKKGVIVRTTFPIRREDGSYITFDSNGVVLLGPDNEPLGTRILGQWQESCERKILRKSVRLHQKFFN